jgi:alpha-1,3-glucosyltransferase|eukprot:COSAG01_NODE_6756_length_3513_cov_7.084359_1_plen_312_part_00
MGAARDIGLSMVVMKLLLVPAYHSTDFEVHRNWLAVTSSLPLESWYFEATSEWTLDYPPFFAWFEWLLSWPARIFDPQMLVLHKSFPASPAAVLFQRLSVIGADTLLCAAAAALCSKLYKQDSGGGGASYRSGSAPQHLYGWALALTLCNPGLLLVDHVHFQYNGALYALLLCSLRWMLQLPEGRGIDGPLLGAALFAALLNCKHIFLYFAPPYFVFLLRGYCCPLCGDAAPVSRRFNLVRFISLGLATVAVFALSFGPFIVRGGTQQLPQIISRLFPFKRGLCHAYWAPNTWAIYNVCVGSAPRLAVHVY